MPLTQKIIEDVVRNVVKSELKSGLSEVRSKLIGVEDRLASLETKVDKLETKVTKLDETVTDLAGQFKKFDEEQTVLSDHSAKHTDRIENLEMSVFGAIQAA
jgi:predicted nuclease with TOPRIM domain